MGDGMCDSVVGQIHGNTKQLMVSIKVLLRVLSQLQTLAGAPQRTPDNRAPKRAALPKRRRKSALKSEATPKRQIARKRAPGAPRPAPQGRGPRSGAP